MSEEPAEILKQARERNHGLKDALKTRDPGSREVEFQRKDLRRLYLRLLLLHPSAKESKDAETHLWMQTSYCLIARFKQRVAELDRAAYPDPPRPGRAGERAESHATLGGPVEYRKVLSKFRQFLAEEEKFWAQLVVRIRRAFMLNEAQFALAALGLEPDEEPEAKPETTGSTRGRGQSEFPAEVNGADCSPATPAEREARLGILGKALVRLGDLARYREQYNDSGGRPRAGREDGPPALQPRRGRNRRGGGGGSVSDTAAIPRERNYERAQKFYEQARLLVPNEGNASHQLAILASYKRDVFGSLVHYYRALCVKHPYETASENMASALGKALESWKAANKKDREGRNLRGPGQTPKARVDALKEEIVILHARWRLGTEKNLQSLIRQSATVANHYQELVVERLLPIATIFDIVVLAEGALWKHRMVRDRRSSSSSTSSPILEHAVLAHLLSICRALWNVGSAAIVEGAAALDLEQSQGPAQKITATLRRMLPALRVATKWLHANSKYLGQVGAKKGDEQQEADARGKTSLAETHEALRKFWEAFAGFFTALSQAFPLNTLTILTVPLQEDVAMYGFLPLRRLMFGDGNLSWAAEGGDSVTLGSNPGVHPNEEQLMRIADLLRDAHGIVQAKDVPVTLQEGKFILHTTPVPPPAAEVPLSEAAVMEAATEPEDEDEVATNATTEDDPVRDAFRTNLEDVGEEALDDEEDEIVLWDPRVPTSPIKSPMRSIEPSLPPTVITSPQSPPRGLAPVSASSPSVPRVDNVPTLSPTRPVGTTAADLLNIFMNPTRSLGIPSDVPRPADLSRPADISRSAPLPPPLHTSNTSIWSSSYDAGPPTLQTDMHHLSLSPLRHDGSQAWHSTQRPTQDTHFGSQTVPSPLHPFGGALGGTMTSALPPSRMPDALTYERYDQSAIPRNDELTRMHAESYGAMLQGSHTFSDQRFASPSAAPYHSAQAVNPAAAFRGAPADQYSPVGRRADAYLLNPVPYYPTHAR